ncbi:GHKL domain-containing protein [Loigolactobacillus coryniformis subsp. coryniformis]|uniref:Histidine kinase n=2 Tax=Loigolactobacillus coryniformis TaxID=1610 RepID=A0A2D1KKQ1_9LACO|nr:GHKL domain-containing protein [Loigolactobacillus coryniformis]ATO42723.1 histidine kinase [Loigolactobacillus coryniformis subsp. torquens DSM 20004 = KCTC 3535]KRK84433.1 histidine protein kinase [Loigolactobacillus coryniformis subsp. torquens DSM 20004 = KCTC 3535]QEA52289.1 GHKL domain-containing protein [Loigolactobacillus coryniformis]RRG06917.1 MAG: GHKL domain-containing protein [Lactobacillus sp.]
MNWIISCLLILGVHLLADYIAVERRTWRIRGYAILLSLLFGSLLLFWGRIVFVLLLLCYLSYYVLQQKKRPVLTELVKFCSALSLQLIFVSLAMIFAVASGKLWPVLTDYATIISLMIDYGLIGGFIILLHYLKIFAAITSIFRQVQVQKYFLALLLICFSALSALLWLIDFYQLNTASRSLLIAGFSSLILLTAFIFVYFLKIFNLRNEQLVAQRDYQNLLVYAQAIEKNDRTLRKFKHDQQNILLSLQTYVNESQQPELQQYFQQILDNANAQLQVAPQFANLDLIADKPLRSILLQKLAQAQQDAVTVKLELTKPFALAAPISVAQIRMLGIILDNALEAAKSATTPAVQVALFSYPNGDAELIVANNFATAPNFGHLFDYGYSQKGTERGTGLASLRELAEQQPNLLLDISQTATEFRVILTFMEAN